jgi:hypothetical protein
MQRRALLAVVLALTVALAGCQFGGGTATPATGTPDATATPTPTPGPFGEASLPPGVDESGVTDPDALMAAHASTLNGSSVTVAIEFRLTVNGTGQDIGLRGKELPGTDRGWMEVSFQDGTGTYYTADGTTYYREVVNESVDYGTTDGVSAIPDQPRFGADERVRTAVAAAEWEPVGTVERDGRTLFEFRATQVDPPNVNTSSDATVASDGRLLIDQRGAVHHVSVNTTVENDRGTVEYGVRVTLSDVGSTAVEEPSWLDNARGNGAAVRVV